MLRECNQFEDESHNEFDVSIDDINSPRKSCLSNSVLRRSIHVSNATGDFCDRLLTEFDILSSQKNTIICDESSEDENEWCNVLKIPTLNESTECLSKVANDSCNKGIIEPLYLPEIVDCKASVSSNRFAVSRQGFVKEFNSAQCISLKNVNKSQILNHNISENKVLSCKDNNAAIINNKAICNKLGKIHTSKPSTPLKDALDDKYAMTSLNDCSRNLYESLFSNYEHNITNDDMVVDDFQTQQCMPSGSPVFSERIAIFHSQASETDKLDTSNAKRSLDDSLSSAKIYDSSKKKKRLNNMELTARLLKLSCRMKAAISFRKHGLHNDALINSLQIFINSVIKDGSHFIIKGHILNNDNKSSDCVNFSSNEDNSCNNVTILLSSVYSTGPLVNAGQVITVLSPWSYLKPRNNQLNVVLCRFYRCDSVFRQSDQCSLASDNQFQCSSANEEQLHLLGSYACPCSVNDDLSPDLCQ